ncbi:hypothetical protein GCK32_017447 [Trichostrongylus colubriformis]|uniref:Uncharacterized protein n=1 Tax=Trichostrongylus colubriformis TaxID=6319 RepID=A0AAN8FL65_TRICO
MGSQSGLTIPKSEAEMMTEKMVAVFRVKCEERFVELIQDTEIETKLAHLKFLTESCRRKNEELGIVDGYRPLSPRKDMEGPILSVLHRYNESLLSANAGLQQDIESARESLNNATERVKMLAKIAESIMTTL